MPPDLLDCAGVAVLALFAPEDVQALLPDGLEPSQYPVGPLASGRATVGVEAFVCDGAAFGRVYAFVRPPADLPSSSGGDHQYVFEMIGDETTAPWWRAMGLPTREGAIAFDEPASLLLGATGAEAESYAIDAVVRGGPSDHGAFPFHWYHKAANWTVWSGTENFPDDTEATGSVALPADSPLAGLATAGRLAGPGYHFGASSYTDMSVQFI